MLVSSVSGVTPSHSVNFSSKKKGNAIAVENPEFRANSEKMNSAAKKIGLTALGAIALAGLTVAAHKGKIGNKAQNLVNTVLEKTKIISKK